MAPVAEGTRFGEFLHSEAEMLRSRDEVTVTVPDGGLEAGTVLGIVGSSGKYVRHDAGASDGSEDEAAVLLANLDNDTGSAADQTATVISRAAQVYAHALIYEAGADGAQETATNEALTALGIVVR